MYIRGTEIYLTEEMQQQREIIIALNLMKLKTISGLRGD